MRKKVRGGSDAVRSARRVAGTSAARGRHGLRFEQFEQRFAFCALHAVDFLEPVSSTGGVTSLSTAVVTANAAESFAVSLAAPTGTLATLGGEFVATATAANGLPDLHSLPGAPTAIYLDFDGEGANAPYDEDGDPTTFNATEAANITEAWRQVSVYFAMFNVDVTTVKPTVPFAWHVSSPSISGGYSYVGVFPNSSPQSFNQADNARTRVSGIAHELGHNFGLQHQSNYDLLGNKTAEYSSGFDSLHGPIMGVDYAQTIHKWFIGHPATSASSLQDDIAVIAGKIKAREPAGGDGFRADDYGGTIATARPLAATAGSRSAAGIIERMTDVDAFSFTTVVSGAVISVVPTKPSGLDAKLEVYDGSGVLVASSDGATNDQQIVLPPGTGTWYVMVSSHGDYGDVGMYDLTVNDLPAGWGSADVGSVGSPGSAGYDSATGTFTVSGAGGDVFGTSDAFRFAYQTLTGDGSIVARVVQNQNTNAWSKVGVEIRETLAAGSKHVAMVTTATNGPQLVSRASTGGSSTSVNGTAAAFAATWVRLVRSGTTITASRSADGVSWTTVGSATISMASTVYIGLLTCSHDTAKINVARFTDVALTGTINAAAPTNALPAPAGVAVTRGTGTALAVSWQPTAGATGYVVERSDDGVDFADAGSTSSATTTWTDTSLPDSLRYYYRVRASDATGRSVPSAIVNAVNRPNAVTNASVTSLSISQLVLNWRDKSGDSGYRIERSTDNVTFTQIATVATNVPSYSATGLAVGTNYWFRITPMSPYGDSVPTVITGSTRLQAVGTMSFTSKTSSALSIQWTAVAGATGYRIERSADGTTFSSLGSVGSGVLTYSDTTVAPLGEYYYRVIATNATAEGTNPTLPIFAAVPAAAPLPLPWASADIGSVPGTGASGLASGTFTVVSSGSDIWSTADAFRYTYQPLIGDGSIVARVASVENTAGWAKIGVMIRESVASNARHAMVVVSPSNSVAMQYRSATGGSSTSIAGPAALAAPYWVRMVRAGNVLTGSVSPDGTTWTQVGSVTIAMASSVLVGLSANSNSSTLLNKSTFTNVTVSNAAPTVATPAAAAPTAVTGTTTTLSVLGADDHGESNLSYAWAASGPATVTFSDSGTNTAKSSVATFTKAGAYTLTATITDTGGLTTTSAVNVTVAQTLTGVVVTPATATLVANATQAFAATANDQFNAPLAVQPAFTWSATGGGTISGAGLFTAPAAAATTTVTATAGAVSGTVTVTTQAPVAPMVATPAAASPTTVTARTTTLSVLGASADGEAGLIYTWSATGPAAVSFSANGTNAAKSTVATFAQAGSYALTATIADSRGGSVTSTVNVTVNQRLTTVAVTPGTATLFSGTTQQFAAVALDQFALPLATQPTLTWLASGGGTVSATGLFTAPAVAATSTVAASALTVTGRATVTTTVDQVISVAAGQTVTETGGRSGVGAVIKQGAGRLIWSGPNTHAGGTIVAAGELVIRDVAALGSGRLEVRAGARVTFDVGGGQISVPALVVDPLGRIDLGAGRLVVAASGITEAAVRQLLLAGRNDGMWDGVAGFTSRAATPTSGRTLGYLSAPEGITIAYAASGDANLDGIVDVSDMASFVSNLDGPGLANPGWSDGDFNYDGVVDQLDLSEFLGTGLFDQGFYTSPAAAAFAAFGAE